MNHTDDIKRQNPIERARELSPFLASRAAEAERQRRIPEDVERRLKDLGMFSLMKPRREGGHQLDIKSYLDVLIELARGCGAVAWVTSQLNNALWLAAQFEPQIREQLFAEPEICIAAVLNGQFKVQRVTGGYVVDGRWPFCSGCYQSNRVFLGVFMEDAHGQVAPCFLIVPTSSVEIVDDWQVSGLAASNSNTIVARELFVPDTCVAWIGAVLTSQITVDALDAPIYRAPMMPFATTTVGSIAIGLAEAMLDEFKAQLTGRPITFTNYANRSEAAVTHLLLGEVAAKIHAARLIFYRAAADLERAAEHDEPMPIPSRIATRAQTVYGVRLCLEAVQSLLNASGGGAIFLTNPLQRIARDLQALAMHPTLTLETSLEMYGRGQLGMAPNTPFP